MLAMSPDVYRHMAMIVGAEVSISVNNRNAMNSHTLRWLFLRTNRQDDLTSKKDVGARNRRVQ